MGITLSYRGLLASGFFDLDAVVSGISKDAEKRGYRTELTKMEFEPNKIGVYVRVPRAKFPLKFTFMRHVDKQSSTQYFILDEYTDIDWLEGKNEGIGVRDMKSFLNHVNRKYFAGGLEITGPR